MQEETRVRIVVAHEQSLFREAVKVVLSGQGDLEVVGEARDGYEAVAESERTRPDLVLIQGALPNGDCVRTTWLIKQRVPECRVLILADGEDQRLLIEALDAGASGYLTSDAPLERLIEATRSVPRGEMLIPPDMMGPLLSRLIARRREQHEAFRRLARLTRRERQVLALLVDGADNDAIAQELVISPETARTHVQNVLGKLALHSRLEAAAFVRKHGFLEELVRA